MAFPKTTKIWFLGCPHFGHANIIKLAGRPFKDVEEMNETLLSNIQSSVRSDDILYLLGDIAWGDPGYFLQHVPCPVIVVMGNHDDPAVINSYVGEGGLIAATCNYHFNEGMGPTGMALFHYPIEDWERRYRGSIHLHAHTHAKQFRNPSLPRQSDSALDLPNRYPIDIICNRFNVGADATGFRPVCLDEIVASARSTS